MIPYRNCEVIASVVFFFVVKILCNFAVWYRVMYKKQPTLSSIPERNENEEELLTNKWVPKKKHEVLKAKYKCLKKLFQIYDASVIGILPDSYRTDDYLEEDNTKKKRKKRSHRTKTDACAGTTEISSGDVSHSDESEKASIATAVIRDLKTTKCSCTSTQMETAVLKDHKYVGTRDSKEDVMSEEDRGRFFERDRDHNYGCEYTQTSSPHQIPYLMINEKPKLTRFQCFIQRIFGIRQEPILNYAPNGHVYAASDNSYNYFERRRRGLRFRRLRRPKKILSDSALRDVKSPVILTYVQSVQRSCLMDTTPRQCPIVGCLMIFYGIINYNDHLNLCHFTDRKFICHYCHEGFEREYDKFVHENEHIGISKIGTNFSTPSAAPAFLKKASNTQTDPELTKCDFPEDKLKKIVSFFDKISDPEQMLSEIKKNRLSESNLRQSKADETAEESFDSSDKKTVSCLNLHRRLEKSKSMGTASGDTLKHQLIICHLCGESFNFRRQLSLHVDLEHRVHDKFSKFHSCAGIINHRPSNRVDMVSEDGKIKVQSMDRSFSAITRSPSITSQETYSDNTAYRKKSEVSLSCDPSTNIVYYTSLETVRKPSIVNKMVQKVRSGFNSYKWEPGTKIIRV